MLKKKYDVITIGGATRDFIFYTDQGVIVPDTAHKNGSKLVGFKYASKIYIKEKEAYLALGGGGCNTAITFSKLGLKVATLVRVGNDKDGQAIIEKLKSPCKIVAIVIPKKTRIIRFLFSKQDRAIKNPIAPEESACKNVAVKKRKPLKEITSFSINDSPKGSKIRMFSTEAKPRAAIII